MKGTLRFITLFILVLCLLLPAFSLAAEAQDISISVQWADALGNTQFSAPAVPVTVSPEENRFWLQLPGDAPLYSLTLNISDLSGTYFRFSPNQGDPLGVVQEANGSLDGPYIEITAFNAQDEAVMVYYLYLSVLPMPQTEPVPPQTATVNVHYVDEFGQALLPDQTMQLEEGAHTIYAETVENYTLASPSSFMVNVDAFGTAYPSDIVFSYASMPQSAEVTVHYQDENGNAILPDQTLTLEQGIHTVSALPIDQYTLYSADSCTVTVDANGAFPNEIIFAYSRNLVSADVTVHYVDESGSPILSDQTITLQEGDHSISAQPVDGYDLISPDTGYIRVEGSGAYPNEITFIYARHTVSGNVTIHFVDEYGQTLVEDQVLSLTEGNNSVNAPDFPGYTLSSPGTFTVFVDAAGTYPNEITFAYSQTVLSEFVTVHYVDEYGQALQNDFIYNFDRGDHLITAPEIAGYRLAGPDAYTVIVDNGGANPAEVTFTYVHLTEVTVRAVDEHSTPLREDRVLLLEAGEHTVSAEEIPGYILASEQNVQVKVDAAGAMPGEVVFVYTREVHPADVTVHYVNEFGEQIAPDTVQTVQPGGGTVTPNAVIDAETYLLIDPAFYEISVTADGAFPSEVMFQYRPVPKPAQVTVHYVDDLGNPIANDTYSTVDPGIHPVYPEPIIPQDEYALMEPESVMVTVDAYGADVSEITFAYRRLVRPVMITAHYVDERGETIAPDTYQSYGEGEHAVTPEANISPEDYTLEEPSSYTITVSLEGASLNEVTFTYRRVVKPATVTVHYVDTENRPVADDTQQTFTEGNWVIFPTPVNLPAFYELPANAPAFQNVSITADGASPAEVTFTYEYRQPAPLEIPVRFLNVETGLDIAQSASVQVAYGTVEAVSAEPAPADLPEGYVLVSDPIVEVYVDEMGQSSLTEIVFQYLYAPVTEEPTEAPTEEPTETPTEMPTEAPTEIPTEVPTEEPTEAPTEAPLPDPVLIPVKYLDENGQAVALEEQVWCTYGDTMITANPIDLKADYRLSGDDSVIVHLDEYGVSPAEVVFIYTYAASAPKVALVNVKYLDPDGNIFYSYTATCAQGQDNPVAVDWNLVDPSLGYELASENTVYVTVDNTGTATPSEVTFQFRNEINADVTIRFRDALTGLDIATPQKQMCFIGSNTVDARPVDLEEGYELIGESSQAVLLSEDGELTPHEVIFQYISTATPTPAPLPPSFDIPMDAYFYPTGTSIRVRSTPTTAEDNIVGTVNSTDLGHVLGQITSEDGKVWYTVEINGMLGYMSETVVRFLNEAELAALFGYTMSPTQAPTPTPTEIPDGVVIDRWGATNAKVNFRKKPDKNGGRIKELEKNSKIWLYSAETVNGVRWYFARANGTDGYVMADFVDVADQTESDAIQAQLASPMPTQEMLIDLPTQEPTPVPTEEPTQEPTAIPTEEPTQAPTEEPTQEPTAAPTETPVPYKGYALTGTQSALRTGVSMTDDTILEMLPAQSLLYVSSQTYVDGVAWASAQALTSGNYGFIQQAALLPISNEDARPYLDQLQVTNPPAASATPLPQQTEGFAMTLGDGVPMRNFPDTNGEIILLLPYMAVSNVQGQYYTENAAWHLVQYNGIWGYIRQDQLRMMSDEEVRAYEESQIGAAPTPTSAPTPEPVTESSLSSYGHVQSASGRVNLRSEPTTKNDNAIRLLDNYAFALVLGTETNDEGTWYHVSQAGTEGYIRSDYFHVLQLGELSEFLQSSEYLNASSNNSGTTAGSHEIQPVEDYNRVVWQNPALSASYEPFNPYLTPTPDPERLPTETPVPTASPSPTPIIAPVGPDNTILPEPTVRESGSAWPWILVGLAAVGIGGGAYYAYTVREQRKKRQALRVQQARQARNAAVQQPQMRTADNNPVQTVNRPSYPSQPTAPFMPPHSGTPQPAQTNEPVSQGTNVFRPVVQKPASPSQATQAYRPGQDFQRPEIKKPAPAVSNTQPAEFKPVSQETKAFHSAPLNSQTQGQTLNANAVKTDWNGTNEAPKEKAASEPAGQTAETASASETPYKRVRRTERYKDRYAQDNSSHTNS